MKSIIIKLIKLYQSIPSNIHNSCRFYPTCSNYAIEALNTHGLFKGLYLSFKRILKCNPLNKQGGIDLVPPKKGVKNG